MGKKIILTEDEFHRLDKIARKNGNVIEVKRYEDIEVWGRAPMLVGGVYKDSRIIEGESICAEVGEIELANYIDIDELRASHRPEIDWSKIPYNKIYEYVVWHELGHKHENFDIWDLTGYGKFDKNTKKWVHVCPFKRPASEHDYFRKLIYILNEILADRYAWRHISAKPLPRAKHPNKHFKQIEKWFKECKDAGLEYIRSSKTKPITNRKYKYIPISHVREGIPWAA